MTVLLAVLAIALSIAPMVACGLMLRAVRASRAVQAEALDIGPDLVVSHAMETTGLSREALEQWSPHLRSAPPRE